VTLKPSHTNSLQKAVHKHSSSTQPRLGLKLKYKIQIKSDIHFKHIKVCILHAAVYDT